MLYTLSTTPMDRQDNQRTLRGIKDPGDEANQGAQNQKAAKDTEHAIDKTELSDLRNRKSYKPTHNGTNCCECEVFSAFLMFCLLEESNYKKHRS